MGDTADDAPPLVAAPRHLRRRTFHEEIPDTLLVPDVEPIPMESTDSRIPKRKAGMASGWIQPYGRKRVVALLAVILVSISIPALLFALILAG